jgi:pimeloyl-ACP methyl ester carboxylesterase
MMLRTLCAFGILALCPVGKVFAQTAFTVASLPGGEVLVPVLYREALVAPARYRVVFIPGSGCVGMQSIADRYFRGLLHAQVLVLHKPGVDLTATAASCTPGFVRWDALSRWSAAAQIALHADSTPRSASGLPQILVGASEGAEILPSLAAHVANLHAQVMISSSGLNPRETLQLQARRLGADAALREIEAAIASDEHDDTVYQGRTLKYWRDLWSWRVTTPLLAGNVPVMQVWGDADALVPASAYMKFAELAAVNEINAGSTDHVCIKRLAKADHGLQSPDRDGVQWLWAQLERWSRMPGGSPCAVINATD